MTRWVVAVLLVLVTLGDAAAVAAEGGFVTRKSIDSIADFSGGSFERTALLNLPGEGISAVHLLPIGLAGGWVTDSRTLLTARLDCAAAAYGQFIYVIGGRGSGGTFLSSVERLTANADGAIASSGYVTPLPVALAGAGAFVYEGSAGPRLYVVGGAATGFWPSRFVYSTTISPGNGALGSQWRQEEALEYGVYYAAIALRGADVFLLGGIEILDGNRRVSEEIAQARLTADGSILAWQYESFFSGEVYPNGVAAAQAIVHRDPIGDTLFVVGGRGNIGGDADASGLTVAYADIDTDGSLSTWRLSGGSLPLPLHGHGAALVGGQEILLTGGRATANHSLERAAKAALVELEREGYRLHDWCEGLDPEACKIGYWQAGAPLPDARAYHGSAKVGDWVYVLGGGNADNVATSTIYRGTISGMSNLYAPDGVYESPLIPMGNSDVVRLEWDATVPAGTTMTLQYAACSDVGVCQWVEPAIAVTGAATHVPAAPLSGVPRFRFRLSLTRSAATPTSSPRLERLDVYYATTPPDISVTIGATSSPPRAGGSVRPGDTVSYAIDVLNSGGVAVPGSVLVAVLPEQMTLQGGQCAGGSLWQAMGDNSYRCPATTVPAGGSTRSTLNALVGQVPPEVTVLTLSATASMPTMTDMAVPPRAFNDPTPANNTATKALDTTPLALTGAVSASPASGSQVTPGQQVEYRLEYRLVGGGGSSTTGVVISAGINTALLTDIQPLDGGVLQGSSVRWYQSSLSVPAGQTASALYTARFLATVRRPLDNGTGIAVPFTAWSNQLPAEVIGSASHQVVSAPALVVSLSADVGTAVVRPGQTLTYTVTGRNDGGMNAAGVGASLTLGPGLVYVSSQPVAQVSGQSLSWAIGALAVDTPVTLKVTARVADTVVHGQTLPATAGLSGSGAASAQASLTHTVGVPAALSLGKAAEAAGGFARPGGTVVYRLTVGNTGGETSEAITVSDYVPLYCYGPNGEPPGTLLRWQLPGLAGTQSTTVTYQATVADPLAEAVRYIEGPRATAAAAGRTAGSGTVQTPVRHRPNLWLELSDGVSVTSPGQDLTYSVRYGNRGGTTGAVTVTVRLGPELGWQGGEGWQPLPDGGYRYSLGEVTEGTSGTLSFRARVAGGVPADDPTLGLRAEATITGPEPDGDPYDNTSVDINVVSGPDLAVTSLTVSPPAPQRWQSLTLAVTVANLGADHLAAYATGAADLVWVEVYIKPAVSAPPVGPTDSLGGLCEDQGCLTTRPAFRRSVPAGSLGPGQTVTIEFPSLLVLSGAGVFDLYAQVDTGGDAVHGGFREGNESNNLASLRRLLVSDVPPGSSGVLMPIVTGGVPH